MIRTFLQIISEDKKEDREREYQMMIRREKFQREAQAESRREDNEWELNSDCPEEGLKAHALLNWLESNGDVEVLSSDEKAKLSELKQRLNQLEEKKSELGTEGEDIEDIESEIEDIEDEIEELEKKIDVYNIAPSGEYWEGTEFVVLSDDLGDREYVVFTPSEIDEGCKDYLNDYFKSDGLGSIRASFLEHYIDEDKVRDYAEEIYGNDVYQNPDAYLSDSDRDLSRNQIIEIEKLENKIKVAKEFIDSLRELDSERFNDRFKQNKIEETEDLISDLEYDIEQIEEEPDGDYNEDAMSRKVEELVDDSMYNPISFLDNMGEDYKSFVDVDELIEGMIEADGYGHHLNHYDGNADEVEVLGETFWVMRID